MKHIAVILVLLTSCVLQVKAEEDAFEKILSSSYDSIRIEMMKTACAIEGIKDSAFLAELAEGRVDSAAVRHPDALPPYLKQMLLETNKRFDGESVNKNDSLAKAIRANIMGRLLMQDYKKEAEIITRFSGHKKALDSLFKEASEFMKSKKDSTFTDFQKKYPHSQFSSLIPTHGKEGNTENKHIIYIIAGVIITLFLLLALAYFAFALIKSNKKISEMQSQLDGKSKKTSDASETELPPLPVTDNLSTQENEDEEKVKEPIDESKINAFAEHHDNWTVVGSSVIGNSHISMELPCQDNCKYAYVKNGWGIAITSDGAGSVAHSDIGSRIVVERGIHYFRNVIDQKKWAEDSILPSEAEWVSIAYTTLKAIRDDMEKLASAKGVEFKSLSATAIVVIHSPKGFLVTHVGDGRAGYQDDSKEWKALITPHKGEEANQTIFMTSEFWNLPYYVMSGVMVPESHVVPCNPIAFTLMSDGCEHTSWNCYTCNKDTGIYSDPNLPHAGFFNAVTEKLSDGITPETKMRWGKFLTAGNSSFANEPDDKTMIVGVLKQ